MLCVFQQSDAEQPFVIDAEGLHEALGNVARGSFFHHQPECLAVVNLLHGFTVVVQHDACEQRGVVVHSLFNGLPQSFLVQAAVEGVQIWNVVTILTLVCYALGIYTILRFA